MCLVTCFVTCCALKHRLFSSKSRSRCYLAFESRSSAAKSHRPFKSLLISITTNRITVAPEVSLRSSALGLRQPPLQVRPWRHPSLPLGGLPVQPQNPCRHRHLPLPFLPRYRLRHGSIRHRLPRLLRRPGRALLRLLSRRFSVGAMVSGSSQGQGQQRTTKMALSQGYVNQGKRVSEDAVGLSGELESMIADHQKSKGSSTLVRASSSNFMLTGNLGNLRTGGGGGNVNSNNVQDYVPKTAREETPMMMNGNVGKSALKEEEKKQGTEATSICRALSTRMDPETLKIMGNEDYKNGNFVEALSLYDAAISIDPNKASYRSNKSAALTALGQILDVVFECREAVRIEPHYHRAHHRLATLYIRLGEAEKATYHFRYSGPEADQEDLAKVRNLQAHLNKCTEARRLRDWNTLIKATENVIAAGADSAPQIFALQAEALLKVHRHQESDEALSRGPRFEVDACTKYFGPISNASMLVTRAQVDLSAGRIDNALEAIHRAHRLDSNNKEAVMVMRKARAVAGARSKGNDFFKTSRFSEGCVAYGEGLEQDPYNSVLLCNRAACRSKLGQFDKAIEDCNAALNVRPSYNKARLRRADCNAKLGKWDASVQDYEILLEQTPDDEEVNRALSKVRTQRKKQRGEA